MRISIWITLIFSSIVRVLIVACLQRKKKIPEEQHRTAENKTTEANLNESCIDKNNYHKSEGHGKKKNESKKRKSSKYQTSDETISPEKKPKQDQETGDSLETTEKIPTRKNDDIRPKRSMRAPSKFHDYI